MYRTQADMLKRRLISQGVANGTVDAFQGQEKDLVILSCVRSSAEGQVGFADEKRSNVAITRARKGFIIVGNEDTLCYNRHFRYIIHTLKEEGASWNDKELRAWMQWHCNDEEDDFDQAEEGFGQAEEDFEDVGAENDLEASVGSLPCGDERIHCEYEKQKDMDVEKMSFEEVDD